jgi:hypothetical protein
MEQAEAAGTALCFVVIWPGTLLCHFSLIIYHMMVIGWDDTPSFDILNESKYKVRLLVYGKHQHTYKEG